MLIFSNSHHTSYSLNVSGCLINMRGDRLMRTLHWISWISFFMLCTFILEQYWWEAIKYTGTAERRRREIASCSLVRRHKQGPAGQLWTLCLLQMWPFNRRGSFISNIQRIWLKIPHCMGEYCAMHRYTYWIPGSRWGKIIALHSNHTALC